jgi:L-alanine-DL-glutamate epimerase-like enolase superfamily enzyme
MTRISRIELHHVRIPLPATFRPAWIPGFPMNQNRFTLVRLFTDDGVEGISAGPAMTNERDGLGNLIGPYLLGEDPTDIDLIQQRIREVGYLGWRNHWIEPACWDIKGKLAGKPVCELLGGAPREVELYASTGEVKSPEARIEEVQARYDEGFRTVKLRVHEDEASDIRHVERVCAAMGDKMKIGVDANQAWRVTIVADSPLWDLARAKRFADACAGAGISWIEEPLAMDAWDEQAALREYSKVPIAGGELHTGGLPELRMMIRRGCYDIYQPDAIFTGGIAQTIEVARLCREHGVLYTPHTWTNGIGFAVNLQLVGAAGFADEKALEYPYAPPGWTIEGRDGILEQPFTHTRGKLQMPTTPGLGISLDRRAMRRWAKRFFVMDKARLVFYSLRDRGIRASREIDAARKAKKGS